MSEIVINASSVSSEVPIWLKKANDGHYFIERKPNRQGSSIDRFPISLKFAEQLQTMTVEDAWLAMENHTGAGLGVCPCEQHSKSETGQNKMRL